MAKTKKLAKKKAKKRIPQLFKQARKHPDVRIANRLIRRVRRLAMRFRMRLSPYKNEYCKHCYVRLKPGRNARVRINGGKIVIYCLDCKNFRRIPLVKKSAKKPRPSGKTNK